MCLDRAEGSSNRSYGEGSAQHRDLLGLLAPAGCCVCQEHRRAVEGAGEQVQLHLVAGCLQRQGVREALAAHLAKLMSDVGGRRAVSPEQEAPVDLPASGET
jgi:hypothetical protein